VIICHEKFTNQLDAYVRNKAQENLDALHLKEKKVQAHNKHVENGDNKYGRVWHNKNLPSSVAFHTDKGTVDPHEKATVVKQRAIDSYRESTSRPNDF
jgi:hypothetical protein